MFLLELSFEISDCHTLILFNWKQVYFSLGWTGTVKNWLLVFATKAFTGSLMACCDRAKLAFNTSSCSFVELGPHCQLQNSTELKQLAAAKGLASSQNKSWDFCHSLAITLPRSEAIQVVLALWTTPALMTPTNTFNSVCAGQCLSTDLKHRACLRELRATGIVQQKRGIYKGCQKTNGHFSVGLGFWGRIDVTMHKWHQRFLEEWEKLDTWLRGIMSRNVKCQEETCILSYEGVLAAVILLRSS